MDRSGDRLHEDAFGNRLPKKRNAAQVDALLLDTFVLKSRHEDGGELSTSVGKLAHEVESRDFAQINVDEQTVRLGHSRSGEKIFGRRKSLHAISEHRQQPRQSFAQTRIIIDERNRVFHL